MREKTFGKPAGRDGNAQADTVDSCLWESGGRYGGAAYDDTAGIPVYAIGKGAVKVRELLEEYGDIFGVIFFGVFILRIFRELFIYVGGIHDFF